MATAAKTLTRALRSTPATSSLRTTAARTTRYALPQQSFRFQSRRGYASGAGQAGGSSKTLYWLFGLGAAAGVGGYTFSQYGDVLKQNSAGEGPKIFTPTKEDYQKVYNYIAELLVEKDDYDDGSYGPVLVRLAWHCSGTFDKETGTGGSNGATMRFAPEGDHGANAGLKNARDFLQPVKEKYPWITYSDLWTLAGVCAIQEMQGPIIPWRPGRSDRDVSYCTPDGRLPDGAKGQDHLRAVFYRMGFNDQEIVALSGAHALGRCHPDRSGFDGPWDFSPTVMTNEYFRLLMDEKWSWRKWNGPKQYTDNKSKTLMMLPTDMALIKDAAFKKHVERYARDSQVFFNDFRDVFCKLIELGVPFTSKAEDRIEFQPTE
jgi:cytochrome c peroxidase